MNVENQLQKRNKATLQSKREQKRKQGEQKAKEWKIESEYAKCCPR